ncbi:hypothetical protein [Paenibacillus ferrarius]|uniref:hypothetical protein n=1 Tax=Paenibacillus ferrarius TaxID=1469647 RepID=UPI003D2CA26A
MTLSDNKLIWLENNLIKYIVIILLITLIGLQIYGELKNIHLLTSFFTKLQQALKDNEGILINVASIFIGIYFTVFTLLGSVTSKSTFSEIKKHNFFKFVKFIKHAAIGAFIYMFYSIAISIIEKYTDKINSYLTAILFVLLVYMLLSALRLGLIIFLIYQSDLSKIHELIEEEKTEVAKEKFILHRLDNFLAIHEKEVAIQQAREMAEFLERRRTQTSSDNT